MRAIRATAAIAVLALVVGACGGGTATTAPSSAASAAPPSAAASEAAASPGDSASAPANTPIAINGSTPAPGQTEIRWYCCLGGGDAPEQVDVEKKVVEEFNASHPNIHLTFEAVPYAGANDALATEIASGNGPDIVGPVGIGGANAFHSRRTTTTCRESRRTRSTSTSSTRARSGSRSRFTRRRCSTRRASSTRPASRSRRTSTATSTRCRTARWPTGTTTPSTRSPSC